MHPARAHARLVSGLRLWMGVLATGVLLLVCSTGIPLDHKRPLGLMPAPRAAVLGSLRQGALPGAAVGAATGSRMDG